MFSHFTFTVFLSAVLPVGLYYWIYKMHYGKKPVLFWKQSSKWKKFLSTYVSSLQTEYWSLYLFPGGKLQTIFAAILPKRYSISYHREIVATSDGGQFSLAWSNVDNLKASKKPIVFIYPGLVSTTNSAYVNELAASILKKDYAVVVMCNRGLETPCLTGKTFCATHTIDVDQAITLVKERYSHSPIVAIGISLGGLVLTRYLSLKGPESKLLASFVYCSPFNPVLGSASLEKWDNWICYNLVLSAQLKRLYKRFQEKFVGLVNHEAVMNARSIRQFDAHFTSKVFGYESVDHYYEDAVITKEMFRKIKTPTLCLNASDDDFAPEHSLPCDSVVQTDHVALAMTYGGGHVGHLIGANPYTTPYYINMFIDFLSAVINHQDELPK